MYKIYANDARVIYDSTLEDYRIGKGEITLEADKAGSFVFSLYPDHFFYSDFEELKTVITVYKSNRIKFRGRVLSVADDYKNTRVATCEGELCFLQDSIVRPFTFTGTRAELFKRLITQHNEQVDDFKRFKSGDVTVADAGVSITYTLEEYSTTFDILSSLPPDDSVAGHLYITHGDDGREITPTIHYIGDYTKTATQAIEFGVNLKNYTKTTSAEDLATAIIPLGAPVDDGDSKTKDKKLTIESVNDGKDYVYSATGVAQRGWIFRTMEWSDVTDASMLKAKAEDCLSSTIDPNTTVELTAIDMHLLDRSIESYGVCEYIPVSSEPHHFRATLLCNKQTLNLLRPDSDTVTLGHTFSTFTESSAKAFKSVSKISKQTGSALVNPAVIVEIISRLDALEGVDVAITVTDANEETDALLTTYGTLTVAGQTVTESSTTLHVTGGKAEVVYTVVGSIATPRSVSVNGAALGTVSATGDKVSTTVAVKSGSTIAVAFIGG